MKDHYLILVHRDIPTWAADPASLQGRLGAEVIVPTERVELP